jgi:hypothetical protein
VFSLPSGCTGLFSPGVGRGAVHGDDAHLFILQFHAGSFEAGWLGEMGPLFSLWHSVDRLSMC